MSNIWGALHIFHNNDKSYIFFGDATVEVIEYLMNEGNKNKKQENEKYLQNKYNVIKVPHHGTKDYFTEMLPVGKVYLFSNKFWNENNKHKSWRIAEEQLKYLLSTKRIAKDGLSSIFCTNINKNFYMGKPWFNERFWERFIHIGEYQIDLDRLKIIDKR